MAVSRDPDAVSLLVRIKADGQPELASPAPEKFSRVALPDAPADGSVGEGKRARNPRHGSSTDIAFAAGRVLVAGISNEESLSKLRAIPCPFSTVEKGTVVENIHGAHGKFEPRAPVRTRGPDRVGGESHLLAACTCTPLVECAPNDLTPAPRSRARPAPGSATATVRSASRCTRETEKTLCSWPTARAASSKLPWNRSPAPWRSPPKSPTRRA